MRLPEFKGPELNLSGIRNSVLAIATLALAACSTDDGSEVHLPEIDNTKDRVSQVVTDPDVQAPYNPELEWASPFAVVPKLPEERIKKAKQAIEKAIEKANKLGIKTEDPRLYMAIAVKESSLKANAKSKSNALGYFQLKEIALKDIRHPKVDLEPSDIWSSSFNKEKAENNALAGIAFWERSTKYVEKIAKDFEGEDKTKLTALVYKLGYRTVKELYEECGEPESYAEFALILANKQKADEDMEITLPNGTTTTLEHSHEDEDQLEEHFDETYGIKIPRYLSDEQNSLIAESLRYVEVIAKLSGLQSTPETAITVNWNKEIQTETTIEKHRSLWKIATQVAKDYEKEVPVRDIVKAIIYFNHQKGNPVFSDVNPSNPIAPKFQAGDQIHLPDSDAITSYLDKHIEKPSGKISRKVDKMPKGVPMYVDSGSMSASKLEEQGIQQIRHNGPKPRINTKHVPKRPSPKRFPYMGKEKVKYVILHSTMGSPEGLYRNNKIHFVVKKNGQIDQLLPLNRACNHAGHMRSKSAKGIWNGDANVTYHSIGIEVETGMMEEWNDAQYRSAKELVSWLGDHFELPQANIITHSQMAASQFGRGRKIDPLNLEWDRLGLPNNFYRIDPDVATGRIPSNLGGIVRDKNWKKADSDMLVGLKAAERIYQTRR